jgi:hypothetical protein
MGTVTRFYVILSCAKDLGMEVGYTVKQMLGIKDSSTYGTSCDRYRGRAE